MMDIKRILFEITDNEDVYKDDIDLLEEEVLDSYAIVMLLNELEDLGIVIEISKADGKTFRSIKGIEKLIEDSKR